MTNEQMNKNLKSPIGKIDVVLDTDAYNEIDDQYAIAYMMKSKGKLNVKAIYAARLPLIPEISPHSFPSIELRTFGRTSLSICSQNALSDSFTSA